MAIALAGIVFSPEETKNIRDLPEMRKEINYRRCLSDWRIIDKGRPEGYKTQKNSFKNLITLILLSAKRWMVGKASKSVMKEYAKLIKEFGSNLVF